MMKKLLFLICLLTVTTVFCQDPELSEHTWYANSITLNSVTTEAPKNPSMEIQATFDGTSSLTDMCCAGALNFNINYQGQSTFEITDFSPALETCDETDNNEFRDLYITFFQDATADTFEYEIVDEQSYWDYKILTLTNADGDIVQLYNTPHSIDTDGYIFENYLDHWHLTGLSEKGTSYSVPYSIAKETEITFQTDGSFNSIVCGEVNSTVVFNGDEFFGDFHILCDDFSLTSGECDNQEMSDIEQAYNTILQNFANSNAVTFERYHADFVEICEIVEVIYIYDSITNSSIELVDCIGYLSTENFNELSFSIYPNPVQDKLILKSPRFESSKLTLAIYTVQGKEVASKNIQIENETSIDVSSLSSGMYFINVEDDKGASTTQKFIKY